MKWSLVQRYFNFSFVVIVPFTLVGYAIRLNEPELQDSIPAVERTIVSIAISFIHH
jgi:hypothetical protein